MTAGIITPQNHAARTLFEFSNFIGQMGSAINVKEYEGPDNPEFKAARLAVNAVAGLPIVGNTSTTEYFSFHLPVYERQLLERHQLTGNDFKGIVRRLVNIDIQTGDEITKRFCLQVAPLVNNRDGVSQDWVDFYSERGWQDQLHHPFGAPGIEAGLANKSVWVPIDSMGQRIVYFPPFAMASQLSPRSSS
jgi:hypothetical protein